MKAKRKILVVEDEISLAMLMANVLTRAGYEVEAACTMEKALQLAGSRTFDLITLDLNMPDTLGFEAFESLKRLPHGAEIPIVFVSGNATPENRQKAMAIGAADFIAKPFAPADFITRIAACLKAKAEGGLVAGAK